MLIRRDIAGFVESYARHVVKHHSRVGGKDEAGRFFFQGPMAAQSVEQARLVLLWWPHLRMGNG